MISLFVGIANANIKDESLNTVDVDVTGFVDMRVGARTQHDPLQKDSSISEFRFQLEAEKYIGDSILNIVADFLLDPVSDVYSPDYETGEGIIDIRQFNIIFSLYSNIDVKIGRQILTWGTGDTLFINDLFPKDFKSFYIGRDDEYLKVPSDAIKFSVFFDRFNADVVYTPKFSADRYIDGSRISYYDPALQQFIGNRNEINTDRPDDWLEDDEVAIRLYQNFSGFEAAVYYYSGYWKSPAETNPVSGSAKFPELQVMGSSLRSSLYSGIANIEFGFYLSDTKAKDNPFSRNSEFRLILGYEREIATEFTMGVQYNLERKLDYEHYLASLPITSIINNQNRHVITLRLTKLLFQQDLKISLFNFYSSSDKDGYIRMNGLYKLSDALRVEAGINQFYGEKNYTLFAQFKNASNVYTAIHYDF